VNERFELIKPISNLTSSKAVFDAARGEASAKLASYFAMRLTPNNKWTLLTYIPDFAVVRDKMIYAASVNTLKKDLGFSVFDADITCTELEEISQQYQDEVRALSRDRTILMTEVERLGLEDKHMEKDSHTDARTKSQLAFPLTSEALVAVEDFKLRKVTLIQLLLDEKNERIGLHIKKSITVSNLREYFNGERALYNLFRLDDATTGK